MKNALVLLVQARPLLLALSRISIVSRPVVVSSRGLTGSAAAPRRTSYYRFD